MTRSRRGYRKTKRLGIVASVFVMVSVLFGGQHALASSWGFGGYSQWNWYGCHVRAGTVLDPHGSPSGFKVIGGGQFTDCPVRHNFEVYVQQQVMNVNTGTVYWVGAQGNSGLFSNSYGMSSTQIAQASYCGYYGKWRTWVDVWSNGYWSGWYYTNWSLPVYSACT